ncbi:MaoC/PaaZ C-terminal domain-containing protein [Nocardioides nanhaiensis]|uniref:MaoC/PaaZ C-terminal domain-containing protein n=1 Tax=Nocardioides nanhaiensis TaxID=1476871 RepID=A0ABP8WHY6_9ACTN
MPIDPGVAIGADLGTRTFSWTESDVLLYHLGIGAGAQPQAHLDEPRLRWTTEHDGVQVLPSFGVVAPTFHETEAPSVAMPGVEIDLAQVVHGSQAVTVHGPIPSSGSATQRTTLTDVWDKGRAAVIWQDATVTADDGTELWSTRSSIFVRGEGGFGGERGSTETVALPGRGPDAERTYAVRPDQALLYRLCGDRNPLHSDPGFARAAGFPAPILHGLCSYGIVLRELTEALLESDASRVRGFASRFTGIVMPGERLRVRGWREDGRVLAEAVVDSDDADRDGAPVLGDVVLDLAD